MQIISTIIRMDELMGTYVISYDSINYSLSYPIDSYVLPSNPVYNYTYNPSIVVSSVLKNDIPFTYNIDSYVSCPVSEVLGVDVFTSLSAGRLVDDYCTIWAAKPSWA